MKKSKPASHADIGRDEDGDEQLPSTKMKAKVLVKMEMKIEGHDFTVRGIKTEHGAFVEVEPEIKMEREMRVKIEALDE